MRNLLSFGAAMVLERRYYGYIMASMSRVIYVAMTADKFEVITRIVNRETSVLFALGRDEHFGIVHYGKNPIEPSNTAKSHSRLNQTHSYTVFRVRVEGLSPRTTYYDTVDSREANGRSDGVNSPVKHFSTR